MTHHECHAHMPQRISTNLRLYGKRDAPPTLPKTEQPLTGPQAVRFDSFSMLRWTLMAHGGYVTYLHKDSNGLCTWVFAHVGVKIWAIKEPKYSDPEHNTRHRQFKLHHDMMQDWELDPASGMYTTFLAAGDMM
jgi:hypothetical protein